MTARLKEDNRYADAGHEVAFWAGCISDRGLPKRGADTEEGPLRNISCHLWRCKYRGYKEKDFQLYFPEAKAASYLWFTEERNISPERRKLTFYRALTDNDRGMGAAYRDSGWLAASMGMRYVPESFQVAEEPESLQITMEYEAKYPEVFRCTVTYRMAADGKLEMMIAYPGIRCEEYLPLFGIDFKMKKNSEVFPIMDMVRGKLCRPDVRSKAWSILHLS